MIVAACASKKEEPKMTITEPLTPKETALLAPIREAQVEAEEKEKNEPPRILPWNYADIGPTQWSKVNPDYVLCEKGLEQSPIALRWSKPMVGRKLEFFYNPGVYQVEVHPQKLQLTFGKGNYSLVDGKKWHLVALQAHTPGEHSFGKKKFPLEVHLIHYDEEQTRLGVMAVMFKVGKPHPGLEALLKNLPAEKPGRAFVESEPLNPSLFLPLVTTHYAYQGSLTFPPCTEGVAWTVLNTPLEVSAEQLVRLQKVLGPNARPAQPWNHRKPVNYN